MEQEVSYRCERAVYYPRNDFAHTAFNQRVRDVFGGDSFRDGITINDAIEVHQCGLILMDGDGFSDEELGALRSTCRTAYGVACKVANEALSTRSVCDVFDETEAQYRTRFIGFTVENGAIWKVTNEAIAELLSKHPELISDFLSNKKLVEHFDLVLRDALVQNPLVSAELIVGAFATRDYRSKHVTLPSSLTCDDVEGILSSYLSYDQANFNYVKLIAEWPSRTNVGNTGYRPTKELRVKAAKRLKSLSENLFANGVVNRYGWGAAIAGDQHPCISISFNNGASETTYSEEWLSAFTDEATILNNLIYLFRLIKSDGLLYAPAHKYEENALAKHMGVHARDEYPLSIAFNCRSMELLSSFICYKRFLQSRGKRIEVEEEFDAKGFFVRLPSEGASTFDKCKAMGTEIERVAKCYQLYVEKGEAEEVYLDLFSFSDYHQIPSLIENKYAVAGPSFDNIAFLLFSDQSPLFWSIEHDGAPRRCLFSLLLSRSVNRSEFSSSIVIALESLIERDLIECTADGELHPTKRASALAIVWADGAIACHHLSPTERELVERFVGEGYLSYGQGLLSPDEADYFNYLLTDRQFSNSLHLRNKYDHSTFGKAGMDDAALESDYGQFLLAISSLLLKINDELMYVTGKGGGKDFVDWPLYDEASVLQCFQKLQRVENGEA